MVGNKSDLEAEISTEEGKKMADTFRIPYIETSAYKNHNIEEMMNTIMELTIESIKKNKQQLP